MENSTDIITRIKAEARRGDWVDVSIRVGKSADLVRRVVRGTRKNPKVLEAFVELLNERQAAAAKFQQSASGE